jgi:hypothetical protein
LRIGAAPGRQAAGNRDRLQLLDLPAAGWAYYNPAEVEISARDGVLGGYLWGDRKLTFHHCRTCGCTTHWTPIEKIPRMGVNARLFESQVRATAKVRRLDGADTWTYFDE